VILALAVLLAACGGGLGEPVKASFYTASDGTGDYFDPPGVLRRYSPTPIEQIDAAGPVRAVSQAVDGIQLRELIAGGHVQYGVAQNWLQDSIVVAPLAVRLQHDESRIIVIGAGMVDVVFTNITLDAYLEMAREAVATVRAAGKVAVLRGYNRFVDSDLFTPAMQLRLAQFELALQLLARDLGVPFLDIAAAGPPEMAPDGLHATPAYNARIAAVVAPQLAAIARSLP
jgi:lysophospholipase L1-like esterase